MEKPSLTEGMHIQHIQLFFIFQLITQPVHCT